jgi:hypothetical protein
MRSAPPVLEDSDLAVLGKPKQQRELPGLNHLFLTAGSDAPARYGEIEEARFPAGLLQP